MLRKFIYLAVFALGMLLQTSPARLRALELEPAGLSPVALPAGSISIKPVATADFNRDGSPESLHLASGSLTILSGG